jgi:broad specificity phosphatase PhoE
VEPALNEFDARDMIRRHDPLGLERLATGVKILKDRNARAHFESLFAKAMLRWTLGEHDEDYVEPWRVFSERCNGAVDAVAGELRAGETALLFTSAGPISAIAQRCLGLPNAQVQPLNQKIVNCSVTKLVVGKSGVTLSSFNDHAALEGPSKGPNGGPRGELITYR